MDWNRTGARPIASRWSRPISACGAVEAMSPLLLRQRAVWFTNQDREVDEIGGVTRIGIGGPLHETDAASIRVVSAVVGVLDKGLAHEVGGKQRDAARAAVLER